MKRSSANHLVSFGESVCQILICSGIETRGESSFLQSASMWTWIGPYHLIVNPHIKIPLKLPMNMTMNQFRPFSIIFLLLLMEQMVTLGSNAGTQAGGGGSTPSLQTKDSSFSLDQYFTGIIIPRDKQNMRSAVCPNDIYRAMSLFQKPTLFTSPLKMCTNFGTPQILHRLSSVNTDPDRNYTYCIQPGKFTCPWFPLIQVEAC